MGGTLQPYPGFPEAHIRHLSCLLGLCPGFWPWWLPCISEPGRAVSSPGRVAVVLASVPAGAGGFCPVPGCE